MKAIMNLLTWLNENWATLFAIIVLLFALYMKAKAEYKKWIKMTDEERRVATEEQIKKAKQAIANYILSLVAQAEVDWVQSGMGEIKRAQVIEQIYTAYPVLLEVVDQADIIQFIDENINKALETVREKLRKEVEG